MSAADPTRVYTVSEAAAIVRVSPRTYYAAAARGEVPAVRIGRRLAVSGAALDAFLRQGVIATTSPHDNGSVRQT